MKFYKYPYLRIGNQAALARYVCNQLSSLVPDTCSESDFDQLIDLLPNTLERIQPILAMVHGFEPNYFDHFNTLQYATFLYLLGNEHFRRGGGTIFYERLFCLNKFLNSIDVFPSVKMPEVFFISHGLGSVLGNVTYNERLVIFQNVTVGRVGDDRPIIGKNVVLYPGATVTGATVIGEGCVVGAGVALHGITVPPDSVVTSNQGGAVIRERERDFISLYLRASK